MFCKNYQKCFIFSRLTTWMSLISVILLLAWELHREIVSLHQNASNPNVAVYDGVPTGRAFVLFAMGIITTIHIVQAVSGLVLLHFAKKSPQKRKRYLRVDSIEKAVLSGTVGAFLLYTGVAWKVGIFGWGNAIPFLLIFAFSIGNTLLEARDEIARC